MSKKTEKPAKEGPNTERSAPKESTAGKIWELIHEKVSDLSELRYNTVKLGNEYRRRGDDRFKTLTERASNSLFIDMQKTLYAEISKQKFETYLTSEYIPEFDPYEEYFKSLNYDGGDHIKELVAYLEIEETPALYGFYWMFKKWLVRCVKCALEDNYFNKQILVFVGDEQNTGKTTFCRWLCPPPLREYFSQEENKDKDEKIQLVSNFLILYDELVKLNKAGLEEIKAMMSKDTIKFRPPYARREQTFPRRCSFIGNTNHLQFLTDETGNVRFLCFRLKKINFDYQKKVDINQVWAQAYHLYQSAFECDMKQDEIKAQREYCKRFFVTTTEHDMIIEYLRPATVKDEKDPATDVYQWQAGQILQFLELNTTLKMYPSTVGKSLKFLGFERKPKKTPQGTKYVYEVVPRDEALFTPVLKSCIKKKY